MSTVLGIDIGTQSVKVILYDITTMQCSASASAPLALNQTNTGVAEQQAQWWTDALKTALCEVKALRTKKSNKRK